MLLNTDYIVPSELTGYVREALAARQINEFLLSQWLPNILRDDLVYRFTRGGEGLTDAATFRSYDAESGIGSRPGATRVTGELPPISRKIRLGEYDRLRARSAANPQIVDGILSDAERMTRAVAARVELARGQALVTGKVTISENGVIADADYGRAAGHTVSAGTVWSNIAASIITDLRTWRQTMIDANGEPPAVMVGSTTILGYMLANTEIRTLTGSISGTPALVSQDALGQVFTAFGLPPFIAYDAAVRVAGATTRIVAADKLLLLPAPTSPDNPDGTDLGATVYGTTAESLDPRYGVEGDEPGIVAGAYSEEDPISIWTKAAAIVLPVLMNPNLSFAADVA